MADNKEERLLLKNDSGVRYCHLLGKTISNHVVEWIQKHEDELKQMYNIWRTITTNAGTFTDFCLYMEKKR